MVEQVSVILVGGVKTMGCVQRLVRLAAHTASGGTVSTIVTTFVQ